MHISGTAIDAHGLSEDQAEALEIIEETIQSDRRQTCIVHGLAGTGKSFLLARVAKRYPEALLVAPTAKAADVLRQRAGRKAGTIHSLFYKLTKETVDKQTGRKQLVFAKIHPNGALKGRIVLVDEAAMVSQEIARGLLASGAKIIAFGDPGQLPPVNGLSYFNRADVILRRIHRQAADSGIIRQAHRVRIGDCYQNDGPEFRWDREAENQDVIDADVILCHRRDTRHRLNEVKRGLLGLPGPLPTKGEPLLCHSNVPELGIWNGGIYRTLTCHPKRHTIVIDADGRKIEVTNCCIGDVDEPIKGHAVTFSFGYALTVHKAQGSEWDNVLIVDENYQQDRDKWVYTAITRAKERVLIVKRIAEEEH